MKSCQFNHTENIKALLFMMTLCETSAGVADRLGGGLQSRYKWVQLPSPAPHTKNQILFLNPSVSYEEELTCRCQNPQLREQRRLDLFSTNIIIDHKLLFIVNSKPKRFSFFFMPPTGRFNSLLSTSGSLMPFSQRSRSRASSFRVQ